MISKALRAGMLGALLSLASFLLIAAAVSLLALAISPFASALAIRAV